jgi:murein DD-endopeptidase MepM/ murein hydrolase activator NlpD
MSEQFHIIIAGDESSPRSFQVSKKNVLITIALTLVTITVLTAGSFFTAGFYTHNRILTKKMVTVKAEMDETQTINDTFQNKLSNIIEQKNRALDDVKIKNDLLISKMEGESSKQIAGLEKKILLQEASFKQESSRQIAGLEKKILLQEASFKQERDLLLSTAVSELNERSDFIENVINDIGIKVKQSKGKTTQKNSGGPYIAAEEGTYDKLLYRADAYLKTIQGLPLGLPTKGRVTSWYGKRKDPLNGKSAHHSGIDFRGKKGDPVIATGEGKIVFAGSNGGFGKFVKIDHGNGYVTSFAHLHNYHVKKGDYVTRGQVIGLVGNSGRSTGPHLHYEILKKGKTVNPSKFMKVASRPCIFNSSTEK